MKHPVDECVEMRCAACQTCCRARNYKGELTRACVWGGPFAGYAKAKPDDRTAPTPRACPDGSCPIKPPGE